MRSRENVQTSFIKKIPSSDKVITTELHSRLHISICFY